jgi:hypothetical protein
MVLTRRLALNDHNLLLGLNEVGKLITTTDVVQIDRPAITLI